MRKFNNANDFKLLTSLEKKEYHKHILLWEQSNFSQSEYCIKYNLRKNTFSYLRAKMLHSRKSESQSSGKFVPVISSTDKKITSRSTKIVINLFSGHQIELPLSLPESELTKIFTSLGKSKC